MKIAIEGCAHGELDKIYASLQKLEQQQNVKIDLLICCGDFQAIRNEDDMECMSVPIKYRSMGTFYKYYSGELVAPYLTVFIGGNHEAANYLWELYHGGWAAPNIYFLGYAGVVKFGGLRIGGASGIWSGADFRKGHFERPPYRGLSDLKSAYHIREYDVFRLKQLQSPLDIFISHDWPRGIYNHGNSRRLLQNKRFFAEEVSKNTLGSPANEQLLKALQPDYWFSAHLHCKFAALVSHSSGRTTKFLALDKCLPRRDFLQLVDFPDTDKPLKLEYDVEWLSIVRATHGYISLNKLQASLPGMSAATAVSLESHHQAVQELLQHRKSADIPLNFETTAPPYCASNPRKPRMPQKALHNPQTVAFLKSLQLEYNLDTTLALSNDSELPPPPPPSHGELHEQVRSSSNPEEIDLGDDEVEDGDVGQ
mmetsp:Transcript_40348/g.75589  ORF Transcript_40348/g.75589 Transcript_40348/m.75589 type:complete len:424 (-) Transcript_40348:268-1539(-)|eukprot:CAMPEP_0114293748 /NCGR_PEP_ID=MMETSP0059-20121206/9759_1 /TAXON_ID=36894 /ORGANISM="Pyramimonas parkeae, Strain CCMP726" /LENGTH=423 /DNA_ID=CAMNT_0001415481 /DNA_START=113 /DNA_END=1384 /DNA_ORIENTATION=-